ncbi:MAG: glycoside hydrolase family 5 protein [Phycisphaeraceae bacterium]
MKHLTPLILLALTLAITPALRAEDQPDAAPHAKALLSNGDFETLKDGAPVGWFGKNTDNISVQEEAGNHFLRLKVTEPPESAKTVLVYRSVDLPADAKALELSYRVRYEDIKVGKEAWFDGRIMMNFKDAEKKVVKPAPKHPNFRGTNKEWTARTQKMLVPQGAKTLEIMPTLFQAATGTLDFDDFKLTPLSDAQANALVEEETEALRQKAQREAAAEQKVDDKLAAQLAQTGNLLVNGDFETPNKQGDFADTWGQKKDDGSLTWMEENGDHFLRIVSQETGKITMAYRLVVLPREVKGLEISMRYRTSGVEKGTQMPGDARAIMHFKSGPRYGHMEYGSQVPPSPRAMTFGNRTGEWTQVTQRCLVPEGATKLELMPGLWFAKAGTVDLAEIRIVPMSDADALEMKTDIDAAAKLKAQRAALIDNILAQPPITPELKVSGNQIVTAADGKTLWLQGLSVDSMQWSMGENILWSIHVAIDEWHANVIRLAVMDTFWFGHGKGQPPGAGAQEQYRQLVDQAAQLCAARGAYLIIDLHRFGAPMQRDVAFWQDVAQRYKNNPAVLFELFNEPHGISWKVWRDGGNLKEDKHTDVNPTENTEKQAGEDSVGMQALLDAVRSTGANNAVLVGGLDWAYDLTGITNGYALNDPAGASGGGIIYVSHIYPWKKGWQEKILVAADKHPVIITEIGAIEKWSDFSFIGEKQRYPLEGWAEDVLAMLQQNKLHWTGFSFHPKCGPMIITDWNYTPTPYWGVYVKEALAGKQFELKKMR